MDWSSSTDLIFMMCLMELALDPVRDMIENLVLSTTLVLDVEQSAFFVDSCEEILHRHISGMVMQ